VAKVPQQRQPAVLLPRLRHNGGCSRVCRRILLRKIRNSAARPVLAAAQFGGNFRHCVNLNVFCNVSNVAGWKPVFD
jgi:hypothetical protein